MVRLPFPDHTRFQKSQTDDDHKEENQNYHYYHQKRSIPPSERFPVKENKNNNQNALVIESQEQNVFLCSICKSDKIITDPESGEIICSNCGIVISDKIQQINKPERRTFDTEQADNDNRIRTGAPTSIARHDMGLATVIGMYHPKGKENEDTEQYNSDNAGGNIPTSETITSEVPKPSPPQQTVQEVSQKMDEISDKDEKSLEQISKAISYFSNNPREIKRFINALRFQRFVMTIVNNNNKNSPSLDQVRRWIILSLKWPQVVRWLYWSANESNNNGKNIIDNTHKRLELLENYAQQFKKQEDWIKNLREALKLESSDNTVPWIKDDSLREFFSLEKTEYIKEPLSAGA